MCVCVCVRPIRLTHFSSATSISADLIEYAQRDDMMVALFVKESEIGQTPQHWPACLQVKSNYWQKITQISNEEKRVIATTSIYKTTRDAPYLTLRRSQKLLPPATIQPMLQNQKAYTYNNTHTH